MLDCLDTTDTCLTIDSSVSISSKIPSIKNALSSLAFKFLKGRIETIGFCAFISRSVSEGFGGAPKLVVFSEQIEKTSNASEIFFSFFLPAA
jgi:hypothetical protein